MSCERELQASAISSIKGAGPRLEAALRRQGFNNLFDLLFDLPFRYVNKTRIASIQSVCRNLPAQAFIAAKITSVHIFTGAKIKMFKIMLNDGSAGIEAVFFNTWAGFVKQFKPGRKVTAFGTVKTDYAGKPVLQHPEIVFLDPDEEAKAEPTLTPVYHSSAGSAQKTLKKIIRTVLDLEALNPLQELLPPALNPSGLSLSAALHAVHYPKPDLSGITPLPETLPAYQRLAFEELCAYQAALLSLKQRSLFKPALACPPAPQLQQQLLSSLTFTPTRAQLRVFNEISKDLSQDHAMMRLVHGDVGSGKTLVSLMACLQVCAAGAQCAFLAPTELLARQHFHNLQALTKPLNLKVVLLQSSLKLSERKAALAAAADGSAQIIVGTHSLFQSEVKYHKLALAVIDEQHRFGIEQRARLLAKAPPELSLHQLVLSATPIPRTLQLALYSDLDVSVIDELPSGRKPIITSVISSARRDEIIQRVAAQCRQGMQAYWVCPLIDHSTDSHAMAVSDLYAELSSRLHDLKIGMVHGQLPSLKKNAAMQEFAEGHTSILAATTVIEVGVDVPNANIMVIESADQLGLAQLHQLRGRVGRGKAQAYCILLYDPERITEVGRQRLQIMRTTANGFTLAQADLQLRGPGDIIGTRQSGFSLFRVAEVHRDQHLIEGARSAATALMRHEPDRAQALIRRWFPQYADQETKDGSYALAH